MKNIKLYTIVLFSIICLQQKLYAQIIPLETYPMLTEDVPEGTYLKDVNNLLDKYVGTWEAIYDNKKYEFFIEKTTEQSVLRNLTYDCLILRYKITDNTTGFVYYETTNLPLDSPHIVSGYNFLKKADGTGISIYDYGLTYIGLLSGCNQKGDIYLAAMSSSGYTQMGVLMIPDKDTYNSNNCNPPAWGIYIMPLENVIFTKQ